MYVVKKEGYIMLYNICMVVIIILKIGIGLYRIEWWRKNIWDVCILSFYSIKFDISVL